MDEKEDIQAINIYMLDGANEYLIISTGYQTFI